MTTAPQFLHAGRSYLRVVELANQTPPTNETEQLDVFLPLDMLCAFALELFLKSFLRHEGVEANALKKHFGHDLIALHKEALARGLPDRQEYYELVSYFARHHKSFGFRYVTTGAIYDMTNHVKAHKDLCLLGDEVGSRVRIGGG